MWDIYKQYSIYKNKLKVFGASGHKNPSINSLSRVGWLYESNRPHFDQTSSPYEY